MATTARTSYATTYCPTHRDDHLWPLSRVCPDPGFASRLNGLRALDEVHPRPGFSRRAGPSADFRHLVPDEARFFARHDRYAFRFFHPSSLRPDERSKQHAPYFSACLLLSRCVSRGCEEAFDLRFQYRRKSSRCQREPRFWLNEEECLLPCSNSSGFEHEEDAISLRACWAFHLPLEHDKLLA
jgi:hypothetical protein